ncbi:MAG: integrase core domain-containing protein [Pseudomonadota bacterium]
MNSAEVLEALSPLILEHGKPENIHADNGPQFVAAALQKWLIMVDIKPIQIYSGLPWENGYNERFNGTLCWEILNAEWFKTTKQAQTLINRWLKRHNHIRSPQALNMKLPIPEAP